MTDPDNEFGFHLNPDARQYPAIASVPCLALLGEPGIGKSQAMQEIFESVQPPGRVYLKNLKEYGEESRLINEIFKSNTYLNWLSGDYVLELLLDSLDECLLRINTVVPILTDQLRNAPVKRLHLRIACRTAEWPTTLESSLIKYWGEEQFAAYELAPLRRKDVRAAAEAEGLEADNFLEEIERVRAQSLAIKPVTLRFLLNTYRQNQHLPNTEADLYQQGCRLLCEESPERRDSHVPFVYDTEQRLAVAKRIAAIMVFSNKFAVWTVPDEGKVPPEDVTINTLAVGHERANERNFDVNWNAIRETLNTGLFSSRGLHRLGWAHQTYAEYLAASYLQDHRVTPQQILGLITDELTGKLQVIPQLQEVAARIATSDRQIFDTLLENEPEVLLRSDVATADNQQRQRLVQALLDLTERGELFFRWNYRDYFSRLRHLNHPGLADQLHPYLADTEKNDHSRLLALEIVNACSVMGLATELVALAFDDSVDTGLRIYAINGLEKAADDETKAGLIELLDEKRPKVTNIQVRGAVLTVLWPNYLTAEQLFDLITVAPQNHEINEYYMFVSKGIIEKLRPEHISVALEWVIRQKWRRNEVNFIYRDLVDGILSAAWEHMDGPNVLPLLAQAVYRRLIIDYGHLFDSQKIKDNPFVDDVQKRRWL
ncbi:MAG: hypothetical protein AB1798_21710, partial [Spirochaetota bacterium]